jgi:hypothetical protein
LRIITRLNDLRRDRRKRAVRSSILTPFAGLTAGRRIAPAEIRGAADGGGKAVGGSAERPADPKARGVKPAAERVGFRVVRGRVKTG